VLVVREKLCAATAAGAPLLRLAAQTALLEAEPDDRDCDERGPR
jgi:LysR family transcriptional regulator, chromosome initiation inhibitor